MTPKEVISERITLTGMWIAYGLATLFSLLIVYGGLIDDNHAILIWFDFYGEAFTEGILFILVLVLLGYSFVHRTLNW